MLQRSAFVVAIAALAGATATLPARAVDVALTANGAWQPFAVDSLLAPAVSPLGWIDDAGAPIDFTFTIGAGLSGWLTVVDAGFAGDVFAITNTGSAFGATSAVPAGVFPTANNVGTDFDAALADPTFSRGTYSVGPGNYRISGRLVQSVTFDGQPLESTVGAVRLEIAAPVPEPSTLAFLAAGLGVVGLVANRRRRLR